MWGVASWCTEVLMLEMNTFFRNGLEPPHKSLVKTTPTPISVHRESVLQPPPLNYFTHLGCEPK